MGFRGGGLLAALEVGVGNSNGPSHGVKGETIGLGGEFDLGANVEEGKVTGHEVMGNASSNVLSDALMLNKANR